MPFKFEPENLKLSELNYRRLSVFLQKGTIPHALLFTGIEGIGKRATAMLFAMACNCRGQDAGSRSQKSGVRSQEAGGRGQNAVANCQLPIANCPCKSCRKILSGNHPDIHFIEPSGAFIRIDQIRELCHTLSMKPYEAETRVVIISDAHLMNPEAANALLKVLEEPPERTVLILIAPQPSDLLPTVLSRCQHIRFYSPFLSDEGRKKLENLLIETRGVKPHEAMNIAIMANGSLSKAVAMSQKKWINRRYWLISVLDRLLSGESGIAGMLAFAENLSKNKEILSDALEIINSWLRDIVVCKIMTEKYQRVDLKKIINHDMTEKIQQRVSSKITVTSLLSKIKAVQTAQKNLRANTNLRLTLESMIMQLAN